MSNGWGGYEDDGNGGEPDIRTIGGIPWWLQMTPYGPMYQPVPTGYQPSPYQEMLQRFSQFAGGLPIGGSGLQNLLGNVGQLGAQTYPQAFQAQPQFDYPGMGGGGPQAMRYDPFSQELQAAQLQEQIRQFQELGRRFGLSYGLERGRFGLERGKFLQDVLSTPANVFSSFFQARGQVPPYNAQLANILNIQGQGQPFFGSMPPMPGPAPPVAPGPPMPGIPTPQPPQAIPYAQGGTYIPAEPAVAIGLRSGQPLFTFNEQAPAKKEKVKITPQKKVPGFQQGGTVQTGGIPDYAKGYNPYSGWDWQPDQGWTDRGMGITPSSPGIKPEFSGYPAPLGDVFSRGFPEFPFLQKLGMGRGLDMPDLSAALSGFPLPSPQALNRMTPSEGATMMDLFNTVFGVPGEDVLWASLLPFRGLRGAMPAMRRIG